LKSFSATTPLGEVQYGAYGVVNLFGAIFCEDIAIEAEIAYSVDGKFGEGTRFR
jgi:hypothetical protein